MTMARLFGFVVLVALLGRGEAWAGVVSPPGLVETVVGQLAELPQRRGRFVREKRLAALTVVLRSTGTLTYTRPDHLEDVTEAPRYESLMVDGRSVVLTGADRRGHRLDLDDDSRVRVMVETLLAPLSGDLGMLRRNYVVSARGDPGAWHLDLAPGRPEVAALVRHVGLDGNDNTLRRVEIERANGDCESLVITPLP